MAPPASTEDAAPGHRAGAPTPSFESLLERLRGVTAGLPLDDKTAPLALEIVLDSIRLKHGAIFTFSSDQQSLALLTHKGLSPQAREAVQVIRRGIGGVWDMPLHSVLQRRVYLIEKPRENPFIPVL